MAKITKAIIPAAGFGTRFLPATKAQPKEMLPIIDTPTIQYIIEEAVASGIKDILIITSSQKRSIEDHFDRSYELEELLKSKNKTKELDQILKIANMANIYFVRQKQAKGLGHAILCAKEFVGNEPFAVLLGDDVIYNPEKPALKQLIEEYEKVNSTVLGVQGVSDDQVSQYGIIEPKNPGNDMVEVVGMVEKPDQDQAPSNLAVLGRYILSPTIFKYLKNQKPGAGNEIQLTDSIVRMIDEEKVFAYDFKGTRYDIGSKLGFVKATIDFALRNKELNSDVKKYIKTLAENE